MAPVEPPEVAEFVAPLPPRVTARRASSGRSLSGSRRPAWWQRIGAALALAVVIAILAATLVQRREVIYLAVVDGADGSDATATSQTVESLQLYVDRINADGGIDGRPLEVLHFHDGNDAARAETIAHEIVDDGRALLVIGHGRSTTSLAAAPIYAAGGVPAITSTSTADAITAGPPWYFRTVFDNQTQGMLIAAYVRHILNADHVSVLNGGSDYGRSLATGVVTAFSQEGTIRHNLGVDETEDDRRDASIADAVRTLSTDPDPGPIVLALQSDSALQALQALRRAGITETIIGGDAIASDDFLQELSASEAQVLTDGNVLAAAPLYLDALSSDVLRWRVAYFERYGEEPTWRGATAYDAGIAAVAALRAAHVTGSSADAAAERQRVRDALLNLDTPEKALAGLLGPIYFNEHRTTPRTALFGVATGQGFISAAEQLQPYSPSAGATLAEELQNGTVIDVNGQLLGRQQVVHTGIDVNEIGDLDTVNPSFFADFFLWFNYVGDDSAVDVAFVNAVDPSLSLGPVERSADENGAKYRLYRVTGRFKAPLEFQDFPFDKQHLLISLENRLLPSSRLIYAVDSHLGDQSQAERLQSGTNAAASIDAIPTWEAMSLYYYQETVGSTAFLGDPNLNVSAKGLDYSVLTTDITIERNLGAFLVKNLLPLGLLAAITYVSLFFSHKQAGQRVSFGISGILTAAVLLTSVTGALPQVGYTVAIEWGFYSFIFLSATCILIGLAGDRLYEERRLSDLRRLDIFSRIYYPAFILVVVLIYALTYSAR